MAPDSLPTDPVPAEHFKDAAAAVGRRAARQSDMRVAALFIAPFALAYLVLFIYPTLKMIELSFTNAPLIGSGHFIGLRNYFRLARDHLFLGSVIHTAYFVLLTVIPNTVVGLGIAILVNRLKGPARSVVLGGFFIPYVLPSTVVYQIWDWVLDRQFGVAQILIKAITGQPVSVFDSPVWAMPMIALVTIWWTSGFNILIFIAGLRNIPDDLYDAAALDGAGRWRCFASITWPLIWPVTALVMTIQLILQLKIFDQVYLFTDGGPFNSTYVMVQFIYREAFEQNKGGLASSAALLLFVVIAALSVIQFQVLKVRGAE
jgi:multiple sugar transport system permease protein